MADDSNSSPEATANSGAGEAQQGSRFGIVGQYIRDLSFENPNAPTSMVTQGQQPAANVNINVQVKKQSDEVYAVELGLTVKTEREGKVVYAVEMVYGGLFRVQNVPENQLGVLLMVEAPRMIFPFARQILATTIQSGGFPPLMLEPFDFLALYRRNLAAAAERRKQQGEDADAAGNANGGEDTPTVN
ncbi:protein-export chaperone SecB [Pelagibacterium montanilacus]|uniref:protein-export chaperone SecB n=1 Tax=Pelagibacterium montanilacus TaxID=2185280 RepID=UPI000F8F46AF|nr:protein-export chaperone SecB [Pelagibacterium montanilacus]